MADPYVGEIRMFGGNFAPQGWALCDGSALSISDNETLYSLLGTTYGGDGVSTFGLPDLRGRAPIHNTPAHPLGASGGSEQVTLVAAQLPTHTHTASASTSAAEYGSPANAVWAISPYNSFSKAAPDTALQPTQVAGGSQPHNNMMPFLVINYIISLTGIYPSPN